MGISLQQYWWVPFSTTMNHARGRSHLACPWDFRDPHGAPRQEIFHFAVATNWENGLETNIYSLFIIIPFPFLFSFMFWQVERARQASNNFLVHLLIMLLTGISLRGYAEMLKCHCLCFSHVHYTRYESTFSKLIIIVIILSLFPQYHQVMSRDNALDPKGTHLKQY